MAQPFALPFDLPFDEAIAAARARKVELPDTYYARAAAARRAATTVSDITALDQVQAVIDSVNAAMAGGDAFAKWKAEAEAREWKLPAGRLETIFRTNVQTAYASGHWQAFQESKARRPYLMWSAINDSRVRPTHLAMDGHIAPIDDPIWRVWHPPAGYNCRCSQISLTEAQALARGYGRQARPAVAPDKGFEGGTPGDLEQTVNDAKARRLAKAPVQIQAAIARRKEPPATMPLSRPPIANTIAEAERWAKQAVNSKGVAEFQTGQYGPLVRFKHLGVRTNEDVRAKKYGAAKLAGMKIDAANEVNRLLYAAVSEADTLGIPRLRGVNTAAGGNAATMGDGVLAVNKNSGQWNSGRPPSTWQPGSAVERPFVASGFFDNARQIEQSVWHEFGHHVHQSYGVTNGVEYGSPPLERALVRLLAQRGKAAVLPSRYSGKNSKEWFAESFSLYKMGRSDLIDPELLKLIEKVYRGEKDFGP